MVAIGQIHSLQAADETIIPILQIMGVCTAVVLPRTPLAILKHDELRFDSILRAKFGSVYSPEIT